MSSNYITIKTEDGKIIKISMIPLKVVGVAEINLRLRGTINLYVNDEQYKISGTHCIYRYKYDELEDKYNTIIDITTKYGRPFVYFNAEVSADGSIINPDYIIEYIENDILYSIYPMRKKPEEDTDEYYSLGSEVIEYHLEDQYFDYPNKVNNL